MDRGPARRLGRPGTSAPAPPGPAEEIERASFPPPAWRFSSSYAFDTNDFRNLRISQPRGVHSKASVLIDREVRKSSDPGIANFAIGTLARTLLRQWGSGRVSVSPLSMKGVHESTNATKRGAFWLPSALPAGGPVPARFRRAPKGRQKQTRRRNRPRAASRYCPCRKCI